MPGNALNELDAQKKVAFHSGTNMHDGSGWNPGRIGLWGRAARTASPNKAMA
jgi:hypothetical protein